MEAITTVGQLLFVLGAGFMVGVIAILFAIAIATLWAWLALLVSSIATPLAKKGKTKGSFFRCLARPGIRKKISPNPSLQKGELKSASRNV